MGWKADVLPLAQLTPDDRHRLAAWIIPGLEAAESFQVDWLAKRLSEAGLKDPDRLARWADELEGLTEVPPHVRLGRVRLVADLRAELHTLSREAREKKRARPS